MIMLILACGRSANGGEKPGRTVLHSAADSSAKSPELICRLQSNSPVEAGQPVLVEFALINPAGRPVYVLRRHTPLEGIFDDIFRVRRDGKILPYIGPMLKRAAPKRDDYLAILPGDSLSNEVDLARAYDFSEPGEYTVSLQSLIRDYSWQEDTLPTPFDSYMSLELACNELAVIVK